MKMSDFTAWSHLPIDLQHQFFAQAEEESKKLKQDFSNKLRRLDSSRRTSSLRMCQKTAARKIGRSLASMAPIAL
ncbi:MAG: hypothetical protein QG670_2561 [Thermoproteota archaeon]|nr:hypothetical protein [Thermoproteota archaeon]